MPAAIEIAQKIMGVGLWDGSAHAGWCMPELYHSLGMLTAMASCVCVFEYLWARTCVCVRVCDIKFYTWVVHPPNNFPLQKMMGLNK